MAAAVKDPRWGLVLERLDDREMPAADADKFPSPRARRQVVAWFQALRDDEIGSMPAIPAGAGAAAEQRGAQLHDSRSHRRRHPAHARVPCRSVQYGRLRQFRRVVDDVAGAAEQVPEGGARSGRATCFCKPGGLAFAPHPMLSDTDRDKYCVHRIIDFYHQQNTDYLDYFAGGVALQASRGARTPDGVARPALRRDERASARSIWRRCGPRSKARRSRSDRWPRCRRCGARCRRRTPLAPIPRVAGASALRDYIVQLRKKIEPRFLNLGRR